MTAKESVNFALKEVENQYKQAIHQLSGLRKTMQDLNSYASHIIDTGEFNPKEYRLSNKCWSQRASDTIKELIRIDRNKYPTFNSVLATIYIQLRNSYGVVLDQLRKDYRRDNDLLRYPSAFEAISSDDVVRSIFDSLLLGLFPSEYFSDEALEYAKRLEDGESVEYCDTPEAKICDSLKSLASKLDDDSSGYQQTFDYVCNSMNCSWKNLKTRYMKKHNTNQPPTNMEIILDNKNVEKKFFDTLYYLFEKNDA